MLNQAELGSTPHIEKPAQDIADPSSLMARILRYRSGKGNHGIVNRRHQRNSCSCLAKMSIIDRSTSMEGVITEISKGGIKFRPAKVYLLERRNVPVLFEFSTFRVSGKIVATRSDGYGIALFEEMSDESMDAFLSEFSKEAFAESA